MEPITHAEIGPMRHKGGLFGAPVTLTLEPLQKMQSHGGPLAFVRGHKHGSCVVPVTHHDIVIAHQKIWESALSTHLLVCLGKTPLMDKESPTISPKKIGDGRCTH